ncbi:hypothetical protein [Bdellovibrio sp. HCB2-146]|uniref:hypothetical protein n=1 Tax=Bdellovibrio sp. HCB2-146 TaxID=3394362 RepID=UPI0039BCEA8B
MKKAFISALILSTSVVVHAQDGGSGMSSAYAFGGSCASQGMWTQNALQGTQNLRKITLQLRDDSNCKALAVSTQQALDEIAAQLKDVSDSPKRSTRLSQIPAEIDALRSFVTSSPAMKTQVMQLMMNRSIEGATLSAQVGAANASSGASEISGRLEDFGQRISRSTKAGIGLLNKVVDTLPQLDQCLMGEESQAMGQFLSSTIQVATAFAGSGQDSTGSQMAQLVSKLTNVFREARFSKVLRELNQQEFLASMSCLMEVTSESYCQARDAMSLFKEGMNDIEWRQEQGKKVEAKNPFLGYYVLNTHVPNITKWMQKIQIGVDPKLPTDADFQNKIQQEVVDFYKGLKSLLGVYNSTLMTIRQLPSLEAKQNAVIKLVQTITDAMTGGRFSSNPDKTNFFTMNKTPLKIPFFLIGMDQVPDQVAGKAIGLPPIDYDGWLQAHYQELPQFQDPVTLAETIGRNMQDLGRDANISVIAYFSNWYIVDKQALVGEALTDVNYTVKDSLRVVRDYLDIVKTRIDETGDASIVSTIMDTQHRIDVIMAAFDKVESIGKTFSKKINANKLAPEDITAASEAAESLINTVFDQFMVMQARSGFLANRLVNFVYQDYIQLLKRDGHFTESQKEIFIQAGMAALDRMLQMYNGNPANIQSDLNMALRINKGNIQALEYLLKDNVIANIASLKMIGDGKNTSIFSQAMDSSRRLMKDVFYDKYKHSNAWNFAPDLTSAPGSAISMYSYYWKYADRYPLFNKNTLAPQTEFDESSYLRAQLCVQSLAFYNQSGLRGVCEGAVLKTPFKDVKGYDISYDQRLNSHKEDKGVSEQMKQSLNHSDRICAFRDFNRKNMVLFMSLNKK